MSQARRSLSPRITPRRIDPRRVMRIDVLTEGPAKGWTHTHGLARYGRPELELRGLPLFMRVAAAGILNDVAEYLLNEPDRVLKAGQLIHLGPLALQAVAAEPDDEAGYDASHYADTRLTLVDAPATGCECDECARELAARSGLPS